MSATEPSGHEGQPATLGVERGSRLWEAVIASVVCAGIAVLLAWFQSLNPIFGVPVDHPGSLVFIAAMAMIGFVGALARPRRPMAQSPPGVLHDEVKRLAAAGEKIRAIRLYRDLTGAGLAEAKQAVEGYMVEQSRKPD
jgi:ribosomal protein L7/L12